MKRWAPTTSRWNELDTRFGRGKGGWTNAEDGCLVNDSRSGGNCRAFDCARICMSVDGEREKEKGNRYEG